MAVVIPTTPLQRYHRLASIARLNANVPLISFSRSSPQSGPTHVTWIPVASTVCRNITDPTDGSTSLDQKQIKWFSYHRENLSRFLNEIIKLFNKKK